MDNSKAPLGHPQYLNQPKSPYEIRAQLLDIAQKFLQAQYELNMEVFRAWCNIALKSGYTAVTEVEKHAPKMYNFNDILEKAKELNEFVSRK